ncbi:MAG: hypothetical protein WKG03_00695 [Telluria sp.]
MTTTVLLRAQFPDLMGCEFEDAPARKLADVAVVTAHHRLKGGKMWPGPHKNVYVWVELANGKAVGWNENPSRGWSYPVVNL